MLSSIKADRACESYATVINRKYGVINFPAGLPFIDSDEDRIIYSWSKADTGTYNTELWKQGNSLSNGQTLYANWVD